MGELLRRLGCDVVHDRRGDASRSTVPERARAPGRLRPRAPDAGLDLRARARCIARCGQAEVALPGGDAIGSRGLDMHVAGLASSAPTVASEHGYIVARAPRGCTGATVWLDFPSVGATENLAHGRRARQGHHGHRQRRPRAGDRRPVLDAHRDGRARSTASAARHAGGRGRRRGSSPVEHATVPDRIVAGTWAFAAVMTRGDVTVVGGRPEHLEMPLDKLVQRRRGGRAPCRRASASSWTAGRARSTSSRCRTRASRPTSSRCSSALNAVADGTAMITENVFESRFDVRQRARPARRRRAHRRPPRRRPRRASSSPARR